MSEWVQKFLGDVLNIKHGFAFKGEFFSDNPTQSILLTPGNVGFGGGFKTDKFKYYDGPIPNDYILKEGDVFVTMTDLSKEGDTLGYAAKIPYSASNKFLHNQRLGLVELLTDDIHKGFIYWVLRTSNYQKFIVSSATGTTVRHTSPSRIKEYAFKLPPLSTQKAIAEILSSLDDKIELNNQINQNLEALAQALFKQWFVDFEFPNENGEPYKSSGGKMVDSELGEIPKGWEVQDLESIAKLIRGISYRKHELVTKEEGLPFVNLKCFALDGTFRQEGIKYYNGKFKDSHLIQSNDILVAVTDLTQDRLVIGLPIIWQKNELALPSLDVCLIRPTNRNLKEYLYYEFKTHRYKSRIIEFANGSTVLHLSVKGLETYQLSVPTDSILNKWKELVNPILTKIENNIRLNQNLSSLRDTLLPKLISGELEVSEASLEPTF